MIKEDGLTLVEILRKIYKLKLNRGYDKGWWLKHLLKFLRKIYKLKSRSSYICVLAETTRLSKLEIWKTEVLIEDIEKVTSPKKHLWKYLLQYFQVLGQGRDEQD